MPEWLLALVIVASFGGLWVWGRALRQWSAPGQMSALSGPGAGGESDDAMVCRYQLADGVFAGFLGLFFLLMIFGASGDSPPVTRDALIQGMAFYISLVTAILSFLLLRGLSPVEIFGLGRRRIAAVAGPPPVNPLQRLFFPGEDQEKPSTPLEENTEAEPEAFGANSRLGSNSRLGDLLRGLGLFAAAYPLLVLIQLTSYTLLADQADSQDIVRFLVEQATWADRSAVLLLALIVAPLAEEFVFRGYLYGVVRKWGGRWCAIGTTSLLFAAIHLHLPSLAALFFLGVVLALVYEMTRRLWIPFVLHALFNGLSVAVALLWPHLVI